MCSCTSRPGRYQLVGVLRWLTWKYTLSSKPFQTVILLVLCEQPGYCTKADPVIRIPLSQLYDKGRTPGFINKKVGLITDIVERMPAWNSHIVGSYWQALTAFNKHQATFHQVNAHSVTLFSPLFPSLSFFTFSMSWVLFFLQRRVSYNCFTVNLSLGPGSHCLCLFLFWFFWWASFLPKLIFVHKMELGQHEIQSVNSKSKVYREHTWCQFPLTITLFQNYTCQCIKGVQSVKWQLWKVKLIAAIEPIFTNYEEEPFKEDKG